MNINNNYINNNAMNDNEKPGEVILRKLFNEFSILSVKKIDTILATESLEKPLAKWLQRGEDPIFDQLLTAFGTVAEHCLPSQLRLLFEWYERQMNATNVFAEENQRIIRISQEQQQQFSSSKSNSLTKSNIQSLDNSDIELYYLLEKRDLAVEFIFCLVLIEVLKQLPLHPGYDDLTQYIEKLAFKHFKFREDAQSNPNIANINMIADLYAEVIGVLAHSRFQSVRKCFMQEFNELRSRDPSPIVTHSIISLLMGMKFFRIKMVPIEEFEASFQFMHECAQYFQEVKDKDIKHALAGLFVEILVPVAATVKNEVNVPCLKNFVELLYSPCLDLCTKKKHCLALFPLVTCLLCVSQKTFFLTNWHYFLAMCLGHLKNRDPKMSRVALESLYRLLWVYMIRIKCESNTSTQTRLHSIVNSLFPKGSKGVVPRDTPLNIFVKIIQFIAQERLDFAMKEIVFDLLSVGRPIKMVLTPERMSIGLRSFLVVADSLQQKDGEPPMPRTLGVLPSGNTLRVKKTFLNKMLTDEMAKNIGMSHYYPYVRKTLSDILRALDQQFGRPLMITSIPNVKEPDDMISGERKPKIDLFRTCVAAIPRLIPDGISKSDLIDLLSRLTINIDEEMNVLAFQALQNLIVDFDDWRVDVINGFLNFILNEIQDTNQDLLMNSLRMLLQLLTSWKNTIQQQQQQVQQQPQQQAQQIQNNSPIIDTKKLDQIANVLYNVEGLALVMLCHYRQPNRRLASYILKDVRILSNLLLRQSSNLIQDINAPNAKQYDEPVATIIDATCPTIIENCFPYISASERQLIISMSYQIDLQWLAERTNNSWISFDRNNNQKLSSTTNSNITNNNSGGHHHQQINPTTNIANNSGGTVTSISSGVSVGSSGMNSAQTSASSTAGTIKSIHSTQTETSSTFSDQTSITTTVVTTTMMTNNSNSITNQTLLYDDDLKLNAWNVCLMSLMSEVIKHCPNAISSAWPIVRQRSNALFQNIDPNPVNDNRASSILRTTSNLKRSISSYERTFYLELWKSYLMFACSIAPSSISVSSYYNNVINDSTNNCVSPDSLMSEKISSTVSTTSATTSLMIDGNRSPIMNRCSNANNSGQNLFKQIIPLLRVEQFDLRNAVVLGLSQINPYALPDLLEELMPLFRESIDRKQENLRRRKRREMLRIQIGRLLKFIAERKTFSKCPIDLLSQTLNEYIDGIRLYFEYESESKECHTNDIKESYCHFIHNLIRNFPIEQRDAKFSKVLRSNLFNLFINWSGKYGNMLANSNNRLNHQSPHRQHQNKSNEQQLLDFSFITELEYLSIRSMATVISAGPIFNSNLFDNQNFYLWLLNLLNASEKRINEIGLETLILLLENNSDAGSLLEWLIECCYTRPANIADNCFIALATIFSIREYPCDRYIAIIIVTIINISCPRIEIKQLALQLLQILDNRFLYYTSSSNDNENYSYNNRLLQQNNENDDGENYQNEIKIRNEPLLINIYRYSMITISKRMSMLHPQLTMIIFSEITYRIQQTSMTNVCENLLDFLIPWLYNMQLVDNNTAFQSNNFLQQAQQSVKQQQNPDYPNDFCGWGSIESTQMILNNLLYITVKFGDLYPQQLEQIWSSLCKYRPSNLKIIFRYLFILTGLSPHELLPYAKRITIYLARTQSENVIDELMTDLQAVEFLNFNAERTEAFPYFRIVNRKCSTIHLDEQQNQSSNQNISIYRRTNTQQHLNANTSTDRIISDDSENRKDNPNDGTLHTKRHSKDFHTKSYPSNDNNGESGTNSMMILSSPDLSSDSDAHSESDSSESVDVDVDNEDNKSIDIENYNNNDDTSLPLSEHYQKPSTPQPRPLPMPEYGGYYAPLKDILNNAKDTIQANVNSNYLGLPQTNHQQQAQQGTIGFHRCFLALMLMNDLIVEDIQVDWTPHIPLMLHIIFLGMDHSKSIVYEHCKQLLLNLLIVCCKHDDNLNVSKILLKNRIQQQNFGLTIPNNFIYINNNENLPTSNADNDKITDKNDKKSINLDDIHLKIDNDDGDEDGNESKSPNDKFENHKNGNGENNNNGGQSTTFSLEFYIKTLIDFISSKTMIPLWNNEDITAKQWQIKSSEQLQTFVEHVICIFKESLPLAKIENRWADIALWQALQCSSRHYAGRSLQIYRSLKIPITRTMLSDILSRLIETVSEQGEDMQGYVTELMLTLESAIETIDLKSKTILELINEYFHFDMESKTDINDDVENQQQDFDELQDDVMFNEHNNQPLYSTESTMTLVAGNKNNDTLRPAKFAKRLMKSQHQSVASNVSLSSSIYSMSFPIRRINLFDEQQRQRFCSGKDVDSFYYNNNSQQNQDKSNSNMSIFGRSQSAQSLKNPNDYIINEQQQYTIEDKNSMLAQFFCIGIILLETDYEHEFLLAIRLLNKCLDKMTLDDPDCWEKIEKTFIHIKWPNFPGVHQLLLKGLASNLCYESTINLLHKLTPYLNISIIDPKKSELSFPFHVMAMLPYLLHNYDYPNILCIDAAISFATWCNKQVNINLENLATVMTLYSKHCFSKENSQWTKCVVKYLYDAYPTTFVLITSFLIEVAEKGPQVFLPHILSILNFMLNYIDLNNNRSINDDLMRVVSKYIESSQWKDALKILKLAVARSSTLAQPSYQYNSSQASTINSTYSSSILSTIVSYGTSDESSSASYISNSNSIVSSNSGNNSHHGGFGRRELPGRTMNFTFDISQTPIVGSKFIAKRKAMFQEIDNREKNTDSAIASIATDTNSATEKNDFTLHKLFEINNDNDNESSLQSNNSIITNTSVTIDANDDVKNVNDIDNSTLKRSIITMQTSQIKIREHLVNLFNRCGKRIVSIPKSPSVIFSQNSDICMDNNNNNNGNGNNLSNNNNKSSIASSIDDISISNNNDLSNDNSINNNNNDNDNNDNTHTHNEFAYFKEFDFLEYELESQEGESLDNFNWGVRRKSLTNLENNNDNSINDNHIKVNNNLMINQTMKSQNESDSQQNQQPLASLSPLLSSNEYDESHQQQNNDGDIINKNHNHNNDNNDGDSSDEDNESISPLYNDHGQSSNNHHNQIQAYSNNNQNENISRPSSLISHGSTHSLVSEPELSLINTNNHNDNIHNNNQNQQPLLSNIESSNKDEDEYSKYFLKIINDTSDNNNYSCETITNTNQLLVKIMKYTFKRMINLSNESFELLTSNLNNNNDNNVNVDRCLEILDRISNEQFNFPFIKIIGNLSGNGNDCENNYQLSVQIQKDQQFILMSLHTHWETFNEKCSQLLESIYEYKIQNKSNDSNSSTKTIQKLFQLLYRIHFQLYLLYECYMKFVDTIKSLLANSTIINYSNEIYEIKKELQKYLEENNDDDNNNIEQPLSFKSSISTTISDENKNELYELIQTKQYSNAINFVRLLRHTISDLNNEDLIETILNLYCNSLSEINFNVPKKNDDDDDDNDENKSNQTPSMIYILIESEQNIGNKIRQLMDLVYKFFNNNNNENVN